MRKVNIVGAGILGAATAYELARRGHEVHIAEEYQEGRATSAAAGIICPWVTKRRNKAWYELAKKGARHYSTLIQDLKKVGEDSTAYKRVGAIKLHTNPEKLEELKEIALKRKEDAPEIGEVKLLNQVETQEHFPFLDETFASLYIEGAARVDGRALRDSLLRAAQYHGATLIKGKAKLSQKSHDITGITIGEKFYPADVTIATNGVWMNELIGELDTNIHFQIQKGEIVHFQVNNVITDDLPVVIPPNNQYILCFDQGKIVAGATHESIKQFDTTLTAKGTHYILGEALKVAPGLRAAAITETRVGFRPFTANHLPVFGKLHPYKNFLLANGLGASGLTTGSFIGAQLAKIVADEDTDIKLADYAIEKGK